MLGVFEKVGCRNVSGAAASDSVVLAAVLFWSFLPFCFGFAFVPELDCFEAARGRLLGAARLFGAFLSRFPGAIPFVESVARMY